MLSAGSFLRRKTFCELKGETACHLSRYRESLLHKARQSRAGEGWCVGRATGDSDRLARTKTYVTKAAFKHVARICAAIHVQDT